MNTNRKLELKDICGYFPYELLAEIKARGERIYKITDIGDTGCISLVREHSFGLDQPDLSEIILILRPLSDLCKTITHNGEEIIPIVELAKMQGNFAWRCDEEARQAYTERFSFYYMGDFHFCFRENIEAEYERVHIHNQYQLFDYLHELKIDYRGLIESGLAIDCNTLENNPYK